MSSASLSELYSDYTRPYLGDLLQALRLDLTYNRADDNHLFYSVADQEKSVLDFLGGYGANLFGHYHPRLKQRLIELITEQRPVQAQGSVRSYAARLSQALSERIGKSTGQKYVTTLTNSGAETVEAALKHAQLAQSEKIKKLQDTFQFQSAHLLQQHSELPAEWLALLLKQGYQGPSRLREALAFMDEANNAILSASPCFLAMNKGFHGKTTAAVQLTANPEYRKPFSALGFKTYFLHADLSQLESLGNTLRQEIFVLNGMQLSMQSWSPILAYFMEPLQGEGGIHLIPEPFVQACRQLADRDGFPLIFDEIQSGMGRTGTFLYSEQIGVAADYYLLSKSLGGGLCKIGALVIRQDHYAYRFGKLHSSTFAEDDLSAGIALEALDVLEQEQLMPKAAEQGTYLKEELQKLANHYPNLIKEVRGTGLMLGIEFNPQQDSQSPAIRMLSEQQLLSYVMTGYLLHEHGIRVAPTLSSPFTIRLEPAATLQTEHIQALLEALKKLLEVLHKSNVYHLTRFLVGLEGYDESVQSIKEKVPYDDYDPNLPQVAFVGHFIQPSDMALWDPGFALFPDNKLRDYLNQIHAHLGPVPGQRITIRSSIGSQVQLRFIGLCTSSREMNQALRFDPAPMVKLITEAQQFATSENAQVIGLGGYNSIVTANGTALQPDQLAITTGNALTVGMGWRAIHQAADVQDINLSQSCFAALGANGNIASVYSELMADEVPRILLIGRVGREAALLKVAGRIYVQALQKITQAQENNSTSELQGVAYQIYQSPAFHRLHRQGKLRPIDELKPAEQVAQIEVLHAALQDMLDQAPIRIATDLKSLHSAQLILGASNAPEALIYPELLGQHPAVICDVSVPADTHYSVIEHCPQVKVIQGGVVRLPNSPHFVIAGIPLEKGISFACMAETILMGLTGMRNHFSYGPIRREQVHTILKLADLHGFSLGRARVESSY